MSSCGKNNDNNIRRSFCWTLPLLNICFGFGLCLIHFHDEVEAMEIKKDETDHIHYVPSHHHLDNFWDRFTNGPLYWNTMDKVLFVALIMLALELLKFLCVQSGGTSSYLKKRVVLFYLHVVIHLSISCYMCFIFLTKLLI
jgi:hypothetical protein